MSISFYIQWTLDNSNFSIIRTLQLLTSVNKKKAVYFNTLDNSKSFS